MACVDVALEHGIGKGVIIQVMWAGDSCAHNGDSVPTPCVTMQQAVRGWDYAHAGATSA